MVKTANKSVGSAKRSSLVGGTTELQHGKAAVMRTYFSKTGVFDPRSMTPAQRREISYLYEELNRITHNNDMNPHSSGPDRYHKNLKFDHLAETVLRRAHQLLVNEYDNPYSRKTHQPVSMVYPLTWEHNQPHPKTGVVPPSSARRGTRGYEEDTVTLGQRGPVLTIPFSRQQATNDNLRGIVSPGIPAILDEHTPPLVIAAEWANYVLKVIDNPTDIHGNPHRDRLGATIPAFVDRAFDNVDKKFNRKLRFVFTQMEEDPAYKARAIEIIGFILGRPTWADALRAGLNVTAPNLYSGFESRAPKAPAPVNHFDYSYEN